MSPLWETNDVCSRFWGQDVTTPFQKACFFASEKTNYLTRRIAFYMFSSLSELDAFFAELHKIGTCEFCRDLGLSFCHASKMQQEAFIRMPMTYKTLLANRCGAPGWVVLINLLGCREQVELLSKMWSDWYRPWFLTVVRNTDLVHAGLESFGKGKNLAIITKYTTTKPCANCQKDEYEVGHRYAKLACGKHSSHWRCVGDWLDCPICDMRSNIRKRLS